MIKNYAPQPYDGTTALPQYVTDVSTYTLIGGVPGGYKITLAELSVGSSVSAGNPLTHALFKSYSDHGEQMKVVRVRANGVDGEVTAAVSAMRMAGVEFNPALPVSCETVLYALGAWMQEHNPEITSVTLVPQSCH